MHNKHYVNGKPSESVSILDKGLRFGDGCFETMAVKNGRIRLWDRHYARFHNGCERLQIDLTLDKTSLENELQNIIGKVTEATLRLTITRGATTQEPPTRIVSLLPAKQYPATYSREGVDVLLCKTPLNRNSALAGIKHLNRIPYALAELERDCKKNNKYSEGLLTDGRGNLIEGTISNLFIVIDNRLFTPDLSEAGVAGVMRAEILDRAKKIGLRTEEQNLSCDRLMAADECFLTNALIGIWPVKKVNEKKFAVGSITRMLQEDLLKIA